MTIVVTGASGFVGQALVEVLIKRGHEVIPVVRRSLGLPGEVLVSDMSAQTQWYIVLCGCNTLIHCAARAHVMRDRTGDPLAEYRRVNVAGTLNLARQAAAAEVRRFVFVSSIKVNGERTPVDKAFGAADVPAPEDAYGISKLEAEQGLMALARETGMEVVIIRPPLVYGPGVKGNFATMIRWIRRGIPLPLGAIHNQRSLVAMENLVDFIALCADIEGSPQAANEVFLISDNEDVSTTQLLRKVALAYGTRPRLMPVPARLIRLLASTLGKGTMADRLLGSLVVDTSKAQRLLGWRPLVTMDEQLQKMVLHDSRM